MTTLVNIMIIIWIICLHIILLFFQCSTPSIRFCRLSYPECDKISCTLIVTKIIIARGFFLKINKQFLSVKMINCYKTLVLYPIIAISLSLWQVASRDQLVDEVIITHLCYYKIAGWLSHRRHTLTSPATGGREGGGGWVTGGDDGVSWSGGRGRSTTPVYPGPACRHN